VGLSEITWSPAAPTGSGYGAIACVGATISASVEPIISDAVYEVIHVCPDCSVQTSRFTVAPITTGRYTIAGPYSDAGEGLSVSFSSSDPGEAEVVFTLTATMPSDSPCGVNPSTVTTGGAYAVIRVEISDLQRVPIFGTNPLGSNQKEVNVSLTPSPLPGGIVVALVLSTETGAGSATFDDGSTTKTISRTTTVKVRGVANSDMQDNIKLAAKVNGCECARDFFTVSTWPYEFRCHLRSLNDHFGLSVSMSWKSESGSLADLGNVELREYVTYPHPGPNPPFTVRGADPTIRPDPPMPGTCGGFGYQDTHDYEPAWVDYSTGATSYMEAHQEYQFRDIVLDTSWDEGVLATFTIRREVIPDGSGTYKFKTSKSGTGGFSVSCTETP